MRKERGELLVVEHIHSMQWWRKMGWRIGGQEHRPRQRSPLRRTRTRQPVCQQGAEAVAEEHMRGVKAGVQLIIHLVDEVPQRAEPLAVRNFYRNHLKGRL